MISLAVINFNVTQSDLPGDGETSEPGLHKTPTGITGNHGADDTCLLAHFLQLLHDALWLARRHYQHHANPAVERSKHFHWLNISLQQRDK